MFNFFDVWFPRNLRKRKGNGILNIMRKFFFPILGFSVIKSLPN